MAQSLNLFGVRVLAERMLGVYGQHYDKVKFSFFLATLAASTSIISLLMWTEGMRRWDHDLVGISFSIAALAALMMLVTMRFTPLTDSIALAFSMWHLSALALCLTAIWAADGWMRTLALVLGFVMLGVGYLMTETYADKRKAAIGAACIS